MTMMTINSPASAEKTFDAKESVINIQTIPMINGITTIPELILAPQMDIPPNEEKKLDDTITFCDKINNPATSITIPATNVISSCFGFFIYSTAVPETRISAPPATIVVEANLTFTIASAPMLIAWLIIYEIALSFASAIICVYACISPPTILRKDAPISFPIFLHITQQPVTNEST